VTDVDPLVAAHFVVERQSALPPGVWPRAAALLARQALEIELERFWLGREPRMNAARMRSQLTALARFARPPEVAREVRFVWAQLSRACHVGPYHLTPTSAELLRWIDVVQRFRDSQAVSALD
jgi:hypothetical protein